MKVSNDHYNHKIDVGWEHEDVSCVYVTDDTGATWEVRPTEHGLSLRTIGRKGAGDDSLRVQPVCANEVRVRAARYEEP